MNQIVAIATAAAKPRSPQISHRRVDCEGLSAAVDWASMPAVGGAGAGTVEIDVVVNPAGVEVVGTVDFGAVVLEMVVLGTVDLGTLVLGTVVARNTTRSPAPLDVDAPTDPAVNITALIADAASKTETNGARR